MKSIQVDALVVMKIAKHCRESVSSSQCSGQLLGLDVKDVLEVTDSFPFPPSIENEDAKNALEAKKNYMDHMMMCLRNVGVDNNIVGWYQSTQLGSFMSTALVETQQGYQHQLHDRSVLLIYDISSTSSGNLSLKAFRLSPAFLAAQKEGKFNGASLARNKLTHRDILEEIPIEIRASTLATGLLHSLSPPPSASSTKLTTMATNNTLDFPNFDSLDLSIDPYLEKNLEYLLDSVDDFNYEQSVLQYYQRQLSREQSKISVWQAKRKSENQLRSATGQPPLPEDEWTRLFKLPTEPSRLESLLVSSQIDRYCEQIDEHAGPTLSKLYFTSAALGLER